MKALTKMRSTQTYLSATFLKMLNNRWWSASRRRKKQCIDHYMPQEF